MPCPIKNTVSMLGIQKKPRVSQGFGENRKLYEDFGLKGHEGVDFAVPIGTEVHSPIDGIIQVKTNSIYGDHVIISNDRLRIILAHLSEVLVPRGTFVHVGDKIALSGNTGRSGGAHLHMTAQVFQDHKVIASKNGYAGGFDFEPYLMFWNF